MLLHAWDQRLQEEEEEEVVGGKRGRTVRGEECEREEKGMKGLGMCRRRKGEQRMRTRS